LPARRAIYRVCHFFADIDAAAYLRAARYVAMPSRRLDDDFDMPPTPPLIRRLMPLTADAAF